MKGFVRGEQRSIVALLVNYSQALHLQKPIQIQSLVRPVLPLHRKYYSTSESVFWVEKALQAMILQCFTIASA